MCDFLFNPGLSTKIDIHEKIKASTVFDVYFDLYYDLPRLRLKKLPTFGKHGSQNLLVFLACSSW